jgi:hypothetical protein
MRGESSTTASPDASERVARQRRARMTPWYRETVEEDRDRLREIDALREGLEPALSSERPGVLSHALNTAAVFDPDLFRAYLDSRAWTPAPS